MGSSSQIAMRVLLGTGRRSIATCVWKRLALSIHRKSRLSLEISFSCENLLSRFCLFVIQLLQSAGPHEATGRVVSYFQKHEKVAVEKLWRKNPVESTAGEIVENVAVFSLVVMPRFRRGIHEFLLSA